MSIRSNSFRLLISPFSPLQGAAQSSFLRHREKVLAHAEEKLSSQGKYDTKERLELYKRFLKIENHRLRLRHNAGGGGREIARARATLVDIVLRHLYEHAIEEPIAQKMSLVAIGGYGRGELNPFSDVDLMFLHTGSGKKTDPRTAEVVQSILYMLWDIGFKVGHSTRSVSAAVRQANEDMLSKTALLEARFVAGSKSLFEEFQETFIARCVIGKENDYIKSRVQNQAERHAKFSDTIYLQEPNVKSGCGSLRDYQNLFWMSFFKERISTSAELVERKLLAEPERRELERAYDFLLRVRTDLHYISERVNDSLSLNLQFTVSDNLEYPEPDVLRRVEAFMRDYYMHARNIYRLTELVSQRLSLPADDHAAGEYRIFGLIPLRPRRVETFDGFRAVNGRLYAESPNIFREDPHRMMRLFQHAQRRKLDLSPELQQQVRRRLRYVDRTFQYARANRIVFASILSRKGEVGRILRMMHEVDFLGRYIPEFGELTCLVQHEFFHRYTADEHTLKCIDQLDRLIDVTDPKLRRYRVLFQKLEDPYILYLALLLHDVGKSANAKYHAEASALAAQRVARRLQLTSEQRRSVISLVDNHLYLSEVAQRRNLEDPETIKEAALVIDNSIDLDRLMLLTLADGQGTNDQKWSDWKEGLMWMLYEGVATYFDDSLAFFRQQRIERDELQKEVTKRMGRDFADEIEALFETMPTAYFRGIEPQQIVAHLRLFRESILKGMEAGELGLAPALKWIAHPERGHSELWVVTWNRKDLFAKIAGSVAAEGINILNADIYTRTDDLVLDIFRVCDTDFQPVTEEKAMVRVERNLIEALKHEVFDFRPLLERAHRRRGFNLSQQMDFPTRIVVANDSSPSYTMVEVQTPDRIGLLYNLLRAFSRLQIDIAMSRIATEKGAAIDTFYVRGPDGKKISGDTAIRKMHNALSRAARHSGA